ncbi:hypothetical protein ALP8811_00018 [Aliiroseovarius pelagivivens]|uniref:Uncharacterized protein n=1 Tax=Aliiroseovarius pelagivivens TaxID=1639690 RepID=A0A2R8AG92_9RHOB|nr:hypothetical protein [Aliiroseovarius pelagivivens]SPF75035.1 hypothetical protein ALP8811_00018 [Aliiroseovarius pelagivivens]
MTQAVFSKRRAFRAFTASYLVLLMTLSFAAVATSEVLIGL